MIRKKRYSAIAGVVSSAAGYDADVTAWQAAVIAAGGTVSSQQLAYVQTLVSSLKSAGVWSVLDRLWLFAAENSTQALVDLVGRTTATNHSAVFTANRGFQGDGSSHYIDSDVNLSTFGGLYSQNNANFGCWVETADSRPTSNERLMGNDETNASALNTGSGGDYLYAINATAFQGSSSAATATGCMQLVRSAASGAGATSFYQNGVSGGTSTQGSAAVPSRNMFFLAGNNAGSPYQPTNGRLAAGWFGAFLTGAQAAALYSALRAYMTAVGVS